ncbi:MAG TPA: energy transducer TonB [Blastocatellia bacterium]|nr:energy transducer TonB [Blastocatellia bacterium]
MLVSKSKAVVTVLEAIALMAFCAVAWAQADKKATDCDKPALTATSASPVFDADFAIGSTADSAFATQELVSKPASRLAIYAMVPKDGCELRNIFRRIEGSEPRTATQDDLSRIYSLLLPLADLGAALPADSRNVRGFASFVKHTDAGYIVILGHSENGVFRFPDGSSLALTAMARECARNGKRCIFSACLLSEAPGGGLGTARADSILINKDAVNALRAIQGYIEQEPGGISLGQLVLKPVKGQEADVNYAMHYIVDRVHKGEVIGAILSLGLIQMPDELAKGIATFVDTRPIALNNPRPNYTDAARNHGVQGRVRVRVLVGADGLVKRVTVVSGLPDGLNEEAIRAAYQIKFRPATKGGVPVAFWQAVDVDFALGDRRR